MNNGSEKIWHPVFDLPPSAVKRDGRSAEVSERRLSKGPQEAEVTSGGRTHFME